RQADIQPGPHRGQARNEEHVAVGQVVRHGLAGKESHLLILPDAASGPSRPRRPRRAGGGRGTAGGSEDGRSYGEWKAANMIAVSLSTISSLGSLTSTLSR